MKDNNVKLIYEFINSKILPVQDSLISCNVYFPPINIDAEFVFKVKSNLTDEDILNLREFIDHKVYQYTYELGTKFSFIAVLSRY